MIKSSVSKREAAKLPATIAFRSGSARCGIGHGLDLLSDHT
jgi:hypothetical protein